jgi:DNA-binding protein H-NS
MQDDDADLEKQAAIRKIRRLMEFWKIEPDELDGDIVAIAPVVRRKAPEVRYRHPVSGESWDGVGSQPDWLRRALIREGYTVDELRCTPAPDQPADTFSGADPAST